MVINDEFKGCSTQMRAERERLGYSREQIAERAHISPRYLAAIELGEKIPKADVMVRIIRAMGHLPMLSSMARNRKWKMRASIWHR